MLRNTFFAVLAVLAVAASTQAAVIITGHQLADGVDTPGLAGYKTYTLTATSDVPGETISVMDFIGDPDNNDPLTARGFFGNLNNIMPFGTLDTTFTNNNAAITGSGGQVAQDTQFKYNSQTEVTPGPFKEAGGATGFLRAIFGKDVGLGQSAPFAQLVIPTAGSAVVNYRGVFSVLRGGTIVDLPGQAGTVGAGGGGGVAPNIVLTALGERELSAGLITSALQATGDATIAWTNLTQTGGPTAGSAATLSGANNGTFNWNPAGSKAGKKGSGILYSWTATATNSVGFDTDVAITVLLIPEPATMALFGFAAIGVVVFIRRRSL